MARRSAAACSSSCVSYTGACWWGAGGRRPPPWDASVVGVTLRPAPLRWPVWWLLHSTYCSFGSWDVGRTAAFWGFFFSWCHWWLPCFGMCYLPDWNIGKVLKVHRDLTSRLPLSLSAVTHLSKASHTFCLIPNCRLWERLVEVCFSHIVHKSKSFEIMSLCHL